MLMKNTKNYGFNQPELTDYYSVDHQNQNMAILDEKLKEIDDRTTGSSGVSDGHVQNTQNPHKVTAEQVGLGNVQNVSTNNQTPTYTASSELADLVNGEKLSVAFGKIAKAVSDLINHLANKNNPHGVTKAHIGLGNVDNTSDADKPVSTATQTAIDGVSDSVTTHTSDKNNPHGVTKTQLGLGNVNNTSDTNKPVSTAQQAAIDSAYANANAYTDQKVANLINGAPSTLDTLKEIADAMKNNESVVEALEESIGAKANQTEVNSHTGNATIHVTSSDKSSWNSAVTNSHTHSNKSVLDGITSALVTAWNNAVTHAKTTGGNPHNVTLSNLGVSATAAELNYCDGVTSNIQTQINSHTHSYLPLTGGTLTGGLTIPNATHYYGKNKSGSIVSLAEVNSSNYIKLGAGSSARLQIGDPTATPRVQIRSNGRIDFVPLGVENTDYAALSITNFSDVDDDVPCFRGTSTTILPILGDAAYPWATLYTYVSPYVTSDRRAKDNIQDVDERYIQLWNELQPKSYYLKSDDKKQIHIGFIAQDVEEAMLKVGLSYDDCSFLHKEWVETNEYTGYTYSLTYDDLAVLTTAKVKQQEERIITLEQEISELKALIKR